MKINEIINEDKLVEAGWWEHQAKRLGTKAAAKVLPKSLGGGRMKGASWVRERISSLMNSWKEAQGAGYEPTRRNLETWLKGGDKPASDVLIKQTAKTTKLRPDAPMNSSQIRDYFKAFAQGEYKTTGVGAPDVAQSTGQKTGAEPETGPTKTEKTLGAEVDRLYKLVTQLQQQVNDLQGDEG